MNKSIIFIALVLLSVASAEKSYEASIVECVKDIKELIPLVQQAKTDFDVRNITALLNDGIAISSVAISASSDCAFNKEELQFHLVNCTKDIRELIPLVQQTQADIDAKNLTAVLNDGLALYELYGRLVEDCSSEAKELIEYTPAVRSLQAEEEEDVEIQPIKCVKHASNFTGELKHFVKEVRNHSLTPEQTFNEIWVLVNQIPEVLHECGLPVPAFFNNTQAIQNCSIAVYGLYDDIIKLENDIDNKDISKILADVESILKGATNIKAVCKIENNLEQSALTVNVTECIQHAETFVESVQKLENDHNNNASFAIVVADAKVVIENGETLIGNCGAAEWENEIEQYLSEQCLNDLELAIDTAYEIYEFEEEGKKNLIELAKLVTKLVRESEDVVNTCAHPNATEIATEQMNLESFDFSNLEFNITACLKQSEIVSEDVKKLEDAINASPRNVEQITKDVFTLVDELLYDFVPACAGEHIEDEIVQYLPEACVDAIETLTILAEDIDAHISEVKYIIASLGELYDDLIKVKDACPTVGLFQQNFYKVVNDIIAIN